MKLLYIGKSAFNNKFKSLYKSFAIESMHYTNPLKGADNINEIKPDILYINKNDFPRLWKIVLTSLREIFDENECSFILEGNLNEEDLKAFKYLKGSMQIENQEQGLKDLKKYIVNKLGHVNISKSYYPENGELCIGFVKPEDFSFVSGHIIELNENNLVFTLENSDDLKGLAIKSSISEVSINLNDDVITVDIEILSINNNIVCKILKGEKEFKKLTSSLFV